MRWTGPPRGPQRHLLRADQTGDPGVLVGQHRPVPVRELGGGAVSALDAEAQGADDSRKAEKLQNILPSFLSLILE